MKPKIRHETIAQIRIPLSEFDDKQPDYGSNVWINLIGEFHGNKKVPKRTLMRVNLKLKDGTTMKGPLRKNDLEEIHKISKLFYDSTNRSKSNVQIINQKLIFFKKFQQKSKSNKGAKK